MTAEGVSGVEALILHGATGEVPPETLRRSRNWPEDLWVAGADGLRSRGWLDADSGLTEAGRTHRQWVEDRTDALSVRAYEVLGEEGCDRLRTLGRPLSKAIVSGGAFGFNP